MKSLECSGPVSDRPEEPVPTFLSVIAVSRSPELQPGESATISAGREGGTQELRTMPKSSAGTAV